MIKKIMLTLCVLGTTFAHARLSEEHSYRPVCQSRCLIPHVSSPLIECTNCLPTLLWATVAVVSLYKLAMPANYQDDTVWLIAFIVGVMKTDSKAKEAYARFKKAQA